jgi:AcrR family transcriptional regulator
MSGTKRELTPLYRRLPHGPHGLEREAVARHQRTRLYGAMIESVYQRGYAATTVAHVITLAGVSRRAFYEQFANKEQCFLATYDIVVARSRKRVLDAWVTDRGWANRLHAACQAFLDDIAQNSKAVRLVLVDALGIGPKARERLGFAACAYERLVATGCSVAPDGVGLPPVAARAIVGGVRHVAYTYLREGRERELASLTPELLDWVDAYRSSAASRLCAVGPVRAFQAPPSPAGFLSGDDKRSRVLGSVVHLTLDEGYAELTDPQIAQFAGVSTEAFHKQFPSKEECFLTVLDEFARETQDTVMDAAAPASAWPEAVCFGMDALTRYFVVHPALVRMAFVDLFDIGSAMVDRMTKLLDRFRTLLAGAAPDPCRGPEVASQAVVGAIWGILSSYATRDRLRYLPCLSDYLAFIVLAPHIGPKPAVQAIESSRLRLRSA